MAISAQRDLVSSMKTETFLNVSIINKFYSLPPELRQFNKDALEKLTQNVFNPLSYYLVSIVDPEKAAALSWPLYDTKTERTYRNELSAFIADYSGKGLLSPVMSSYLVNPACYKVTVFMFQLSQLAVQKILKSKMKRDHQKKLYCEMKEKYKSVIQDPGFVETVERENEVMLKKLANYLQKRKKYEKIAKLFGDRIRSMGDKLLKLKAQEYIDSLVDSFVDDSLDEATKLSILEIKNVNKPAPFFDAWLEDIDLELGMLESEWESKMSSMVKSATKTMELTKELIERQTGEADKSSYMVEYNHVTDEICTKDLQDKVNSQQKYILKNIVKHERLSFPNLIRGYIVAVSYILKNKQIGDGVYQFNEYLQHGNKSYSEMVMAMKNLMERVGNAESRLEPSIVSFNQSISIKEVPEIPPLPDLSDLSMKRDPQVYFDTFTPLGLPKNRFNLRKTNTGTASFLKPQNRSLMHQIPRDDFLKNFASGPFFERQNSNPNACNLSIISQVHARSNETIAECSSGFTKQQIQRLLSTHKKSSSTKKHKFKLDRPQIHVKKGLFNISNTSSENGIVRCHSSPNLLEIKEKQFTQRRRKLSIMQEGSPSLVEVSGIMSLEQKHTPLSLDRSPMNNTAVPIPGIVITPSKESNFTKNTAVENGDSSVTSLGPKKSIDAEEDTSNITPKSRIPVPVKKTSSIEKIINRFKRVRANVVAMEDDVNIKTIVEEKENFNAVNVDVFTANKILLPDLLSPSCSMFTFKASEFLDPISNDVETEVRKPRESLGTALGVDNTFLDQFDLID
ncbi:hypothetical protein MSG28_014091 [Choristoneura fumiferana]|uniref:Uncharacterized protein n=1 Tax=Choristoneura fumiferana TaxID=7141 RepID=A0ACC0JFW4_CHOFU|nr:hypothetical protein MSG28_014091 [Choristoneura fumiferana]